MLSLSESLSQWTNPELVVAGLSAEVGGYVTPLKRLSKVHGNSLQSKRPTWGYKLHHKDGAFLKNGIT